MAGFGYKMGWLAVKEGSISDVLGHLGGRIIGPVDWREGVNRVYREDDAAIATRLLSGPGGDAWLLVAGPRLAIGRDSIDIVALSASLGCEVQRFVSHRGVHLHRWERAVEGTMVRSFEHDSELGGVTMWHGRPSGVELTIGLPDVFDIERVSVVERDLILVTQDDVMRVAAAWSVDPTALEGQPTVQPLTFAQFPSPTGRATVGASALSISNLSRSIARRLRRRTAAADD